MLQLRPNCENCNCALPADSQSAMICSYECTFCIDCVEQHLNNVCPNCGGGFYQRPVRPKTSWRDGTGLKAHPAITSTILNPINKAEHQQFSASIRAIPPGTR